MFAFQTAAQIVAGFMIEPLGTQGNEFGTPFASQRKKKHLS